VRQSFADRPANALVTHSFAFTVILLAPAARECIQARRKRRQSASP
jgi:hypothetical protein